MSTLFCRHNRFTVDCPICSKGTALDPAASRARRSTGSPVRRASSPASAEKSRRSAAGAGPARFTGPYVSAGPYEDEDEQRYEVRLERVPGGIRIAEWRAGGLRKRAPVLDASDLPALLASALERAVLKPADQRVLAAALEVEDGAGDGDGAGTRWGASPGRAGDLREELRVEALEGDRLRLARWVLRPNHGWERMEAPTMFPAARYAEALREAARAGLLSGAPDDDVAAGDPAPRGLPPR